MDTLSLCNQIAKKSSLLTSIVNNTKEAFLIFSQTAEEIIKQMQKASPETKFVFQNKGVYGVSENCKADSEMSGVRA